MVTEYFLENLRDLKKTSGIVTNVQLSKMSNIPRGRINNWISRKRIPDSVDIETLAKFFNVEPYYFFMKPGTQGEARPVERDDDFKVFMDELAVKYLDEQDQADYHHYGGASRFLQVMRSNFETDSIGLSDWYLKLSKKITEYAGLNLVEKARNRINSNASVKKSESA